jgi:hypothetical protein
MPLSAMWFEPHSLAVADAEEGNAPELLFQRTIHRDTLMAYQATVRSIAGNSVACEGGSEPFLYKTDAKLPDTIDLVYWAAGDSRCANLSPGNYVLHTCWSAPSPLGPLFPPKSLCIDSAPFEIRPKA